MSRIHRRPEVEDDIYELTLHLLTVSDNLARRFVDAVQKTLKQIAMHPGTGSPKVFATPALDGVRSWWVEGFRNHIIYYLVRTDGIEVLAVLHGARNIEAVLKRRV